MINDALYQASLQAFMNAQQQKQRQNPRPPQPQPQGQGQPPVQSRGAVAPQATSALPQQETPDAQGSPSYEEMVAQAMQEKMQGQMTPRKAKSSEDTFLDNIEDLLEGMGGGNIDDIRRRRRETNAEGALDIDKDYLKYLESVRHNKSRERLEESKIAEQQLYHQNKLAAEERKAKALERKDLGAAAKEEKRLAMEEKRLLVADKKEENIERKIRSLEEYRKKTMQIQVNKQLTDLEKHIRDGLKEYTNSLEFMTLTEEEKPLFKKQKEQEIREKYRSEISDLMGILQSLKSSKPSREPDAISTEELPSDLE